MSISLGIPKYNYKYFQNISFVGNPTSKKKKPDVYDEKYGTLPQVNIETPKNKKPRNLPQVSDMLVRKVINGANVMGMSIDDYLLTNLKHLAYVPRVIPENSLTANVGRTKITTLIDGEQIFQKTVEYLKSAEKSIQIEMFEFQNLKIDGGKWPTNGADAVSGFQEQQSILPILINKKRTHPEMKIQVILDAHKWYMDGNGNKVRHYNNQDMIRYLKLNGIDVVPYPRAAQQGAALQHSKLLAVDGRKVIMGGMNWGTHSTANHDACVAIETRDGYKNSEVDNIIEQNFNTDWKFAWQRLGKTKLIAGPLTEDEQQFYHGLKKEIKQENVEYKKLVADLYDNSENLNRYDEKDLSKLDLIPTNPIANPEIKILGTKPRELSLIGQEGVESTRLYLWNKIKTCDKVRGELFVLSDKELIENIIKRVNAGELDAQFIVSSEILEEFPYCQMAYNTLIQNGVPVRLYNHDERINQRLHCKWAVFDDKEVLIGSTNWSAMGLNQNLRLGEREDYELHSAKISQEIDEYAETVREFEKQIGLDPIREDGGFSYNDVTNRRKELRKAITDINKNGEATVKIGKKSYTFTDEEKSNIQTIQGYYGIIKDRFNAKEKYKRGNNECAIAFVKPSLAQVFIKQFNKDWKHSVSDFDKIREKSMNQTPSEMQPLDLVG